MNSKTNGYDRNYLLDLAFSIVHDIADETHALEEINFLAQQVKTLPENLTELRKEYSDRLLQACDELIEDARLRQEKTDYLASQAPSWNYKKRCRVKHTGGAAYTMIETYIANPNDTALDLACRSLQKFYRELSMAMGMELANCGRCLNDSLNNTVTTPDSEA